MNAQEIIGTFISHGFQLDSESLKFFLGNQDKINSAIAHFTSLEQKPTTITTQNIKEIMVEAGIEVRTVESFSKEQKTVTASEVSQIFQNQYEKIKKFLVNRIDLPNTLSINKISERSSEQFSIIARVSEIDGNNIILEDLTNQATANISPEAREESKLLIEGETAGFVCTSSDGAVQIKKIVWPDMQFKKEVAKSPTKISVAFSNVESEKLAEKIPHGSVEIFLGNEGLYFKKDSEKKKLPDPCIVEISGVRIYLSHGKYLKNYSGNLGDTAAKVVLNLTKKRIVFPPMSVAENFVLEDVPDIFVVDSFGEADSTNYKGTTFLSLGNPTEKKSAWIVDLQTRENVKIDLG